MVPLKKQTNTIKFITILFLLLYQTCIPSVLAQEVVDIDNEVITTEATETVTNEDDAVRISHEKPELNLSEIPIVEVENKEENNVVNVEQPSESTDEVESDSENIANETLNDDESTVRNTQFSDTVIEWVNDSLDTWSDYSEIIRIAAPRFVDNATLQVLRQLRLPSIDNQLPLVGSIRYLKYYIIFISIGCFGLTYTMIHSTYSKKRK